jgi:DNA mismatch repair enzyme (predicted ATPase)
MSQARIQQLDDALINQIAAGEIIDRPSSIVKELVENSLDAGATAIKIDIQHGGLQSIVITDNGSGILKEDIPLALSRHATSKLRDADGLFNIHTLGFRGEALASIAAVSKLQLSTRNISQPNGWQLSLQGQENSIIADNDHAKLLASIKPIALDKGTEIRVDELFFNTPARRKFMKKEGTEFSHIDQMIRKISMASMSVSFELTHNGKLVLNLPAATNHEQEAKRLEVLLGKEFIDNAVYIECDDPDNKLLLRGWLSKPTYTRSQSNRQFVFLNHRFVRVNKSCTRLNEPTLIWFTMIGILY